MAKRLKGGQSRHPKTKSSREKIHKTTKKPQAWEAKYKLVKSFVSFKKPKKITPAFKRKVTKYFKTVSYYQSRPYIKYAPKLKTKKDRQKLEAVKYLTNQDLKDLKTVFIHTSGMKGLKVKFKKSGEAYLESPEIKIEKVGFKADGVLKSKNRKAYINRKIKESKTKATHFAKQEGVFEVSAVVDKNNIADDLERFFNFYVGIIEKGMETGNWRRAKKARQTKNAFDGLLALTFKKKLKPIEYVRTRSKAKTTYKADEKEYLKMMRRSSIKLPKK